MKITGITAEYNPFHNGHVYHLQRARQLSGADCVIAVMSGDFTQRGEPAVCDKWRRAKAAVSAAEEGADLVLELPFAFACSRASVFARGAVDMLVGLGADCISFGCEAEDPGMLRQLARILVCEGGRIEAARAAKMKTGLSSAKAYELAVAELAGEESAELLLTPNNILAVEYLKRILFWRGKGKQIEDLPVHRRGSGYYSAASEDGDFAGAGALRKMLAEGADISPYVPGPVQYADIAGIREVFFKQLKGVLIRSTPEELRRICGVGEGMEHSIIREVRRADRLEQLVAALTSRRYTRASVQRTLTHILIGTSWQQIDTLTEEGPSAGRLLASGESGRAFLRAREDEIFRIITNPNKEGDTLKERDARLLKLDEKAADMYNLLLGRDIYAASDRVMRPYIE